MTQASQAEGGPVLASRSIGDFLSWGFSLWGGVLACRGSSRGAPRGCSALSATFPCVTLSPSGAQVGAMPTDGELVKAADNGKLEEVRTLLEARAHIDEIDEVSDGAGANVTAGV